MLRLFLKLEKKKQEKQKVAIGHSLYLKDSIIVYNNRVYKATQVPTNFEPVVYVKEGIFFTKS